MINYHHHCNHDNCKDHHHHDNYRDQHDDDTFVAVAKPLETRPPGYLGGNTRTAGFVFLSFDDHDGDDGDDDRILGS